MALLDIDELIEPINALLKDSYFSVLGDLKIVQTGVYDGHFNLSNALSGIVDDQLQPVWKLEDYPLSNTGNYERADYGVADDVEQVLEYFKPEVDDPDKTYVIGLTKIQRDLENKGKGGGWRWHKWGSYIGTQEPTMEYLDDEPEIESIVVFHLYQIIEEQDENA